MNYEEIEPHLIDYIKGKLDESTTYRIQAYLQENPDAKKEVEELRDTLDFVQEVRLEEPAPSLKMNFYSMLQAEQQKTHPQTSSSTRFSLATWWQEKVWLKRAGLALSIMSIFLVGYWSAQFFNDSAGSVSELAQGPVREESDEAQPSVTQPLMDDQRASSLAHSDSSSPNHPPPSINPLPEGAVATLPIDDKEEGLLSSELGRSEPSQEGLGFSGPPPASVVGGISVETVEVNTSERIQGVYTALESNSTEERIINALISTLLQDPNPNVRIAAIDALEKFADRPQARSLLVKSLEYQESPTVQLAAIDLMVKYEIKEASEALKKFLNRDNLNGRVREQATIALAFLS